MLSLRTIRQPASLRPFLSSTNAVASPQTVIAGRRFASGDYGSGAQNPDTSNPKAHLEHPGPPPPGGAQQGQAGQQQSGNDTKNSSSPQPKILSESPPTPGEQPEDVAQHNKELENRADRAHEKVSNADAKDDKVPKGFWSGQGGKDGTS